MGVDLKITATKLGITQESVRQDSARLVSCVGRNFFWMDRKKDQHALELTDGVVRVNTLSRYYGSTYQRGHWPDIVAVLEWLRRNGYSVVYGNDCGENVPVTSRLLDDMWRVWADDDCNYERRFSTDVEPPFCGWCQTHTILNGSHGRKSTGYCPSCGAKVVEGM